MAPIKLYAMEVSTCGRRVMAALEEKGLDYELVKVDLMKGEHKKPEYLKKQPFGVIPVLEDGDIQIFESRAIIRYLANKYADKGTDLLGKDEKSKALTETWLEVESQNFNGPTSAIVGQKVFSRWRNQAPDEAIVAEQLTKLNKVLDVYEGVLATRPYLAGQNFSLADLSHLAYGEYLYSQAGVTEPFDSRPHVKDWWARISARPAWARALAKKSTA